MAGEAGTGPLSEGAAERLSGEWPVVKVPGKHARAEKRAQLAQAARRLLTSARSPPSRRLTTASTTVAG